MHDCTEIVISSKHLPTTKKGMRIFTFLSNPECDYLSVRNQTIKFSYKLVQCECQTILIFMYSFVLSVNSIELLLPNNVFSVPFH